MLRISAQQVRDFVEESLVAARPARPQRRDREMRLADAVRADQAEAFLHVGKRSANLRTFADRVRQLLVRIDLEVVEVAAAIARRDARVFEQPARVLALPAIAADDTADTITVYRLPTGVVAELAGHGSDCNTEWLSAEC